MQDTAFAYPSRGHLALLQPEGFQWQTQAIMKILALLLASASVAWAANVVTVEIVNVHQVTHEDQGSNAIVDKALFGNHTPTHQLESFNLDTLINGERVLLACDDSKGCESPAKGTYEGELRRNKWVRVSFVLPLSQKRVKRWYRIAGSWEPSSTLRDPE